MNLDSILNPKTPTPERDIIPPNTSIDDFDVDKVKEMLKKVCAKTEPTNEVAQHQDPVDRLHEQVARYIQAALFYKKLNKGWDPTMSWISKCQVDKELPSSSKISAYKTARLELYLNIEDVLSKEREDDRGHWNTEDAWKEYLTQRADALFLSKKEIDNGILFFKEKLDDKRKTYVLPSERKRGADNSRRSGGRRTNLEQQEMQQECHTQ